MTLLISVLNLILIVAALSGLAFFCLGIFMSFIYLVAFLVTRDKIKKTKLIGWAKKMFFGLGLLIASPFIWRLVQIFAYGTGNSPLKQNILP